MGSAVFTFVGFYTAVKSKSNKWVVGATLTAAVLLFLVAAFLAWKEEYVKVIKAEAELENEKSRHGGPEVFLAWRVPSELEKLPGVSRREHLILENRSDLSAHNIQILPIVLSGSVRFDMVYDLGSKNEVVPYLSILDSSQVNVGDDFEVFLNDPENLKMMSVTNNEDGKSWPTPYRLPLQITYMDSFGNPFIADMIFWYDTPFPNSAIELVKRQRK
jgi:hypothetical protein